jgi:hypothetical protein
MPYMKAKLHYLICLNLGWVIFFSGCASAPKVINLPVVAEPAGSLAVDVSDDQRVLAAIASALAHDLKLPPIESSVVFYPDRESYQAGVVAESEKDLALLRVKLGDRAAEIEKETLLFSARRFAASSVAVGMHQRVLVDQRQLRMFSWWERVQILAHELTHTVEKAWVEGRITAWDRWLSEGFAEWTGYRVVEKLGGATFATNRRSISDEVARTRHQRADPALTHLVAGEDWLKWLQARGRPATYGQAFLAVDLLIEQKGVPAIVEYFRLFGASNDRERNFMTAFGESAAEFEVKYREHRRATLGR